MKYPKGARTRLWWTLAFVVAATLAPTSAYGAGRPLPPPCTSPAPPGPIIFQWNGTSLQDQFGYSVAFGDVNGDGKADVVIGAPNGVGDAAGTRTGYVRVFNGANLSQMLYQFNGQAGGDRFGWRVAIGDVSGDGRADVVSTAPGAETSPRLTRQGRILVFSGVDGTLIGRIDGVRKTEELGESVALRDINGDGKAEILAGAWSYDPGLGGAANKNNGIVRLYDGATGAVLFQRIGTERAEGIQDEMGRAVAFGDVNGDGKLDLILGAGGGTGYVEVWSGSDLTTRLYLFRGDLGVGNEDQFGRALASADLNGDGKEEVVAAAAVGDGGGLGDSGWIRVFDGATGAILMQLNGTAAGDHLGRSVAVGDVNGDGQVDVIGGAEWATSGGISGAGYVRAFDGRTEARLLEFDGSCPNDHLGFSAAAFDVDGNGKVNVLAGTDAGDGGGILDNGYARLFQDTF